MMALVLLILITLSTLVQVEIVSSTSNVAINEARANARSALNLALGELQKFAGPDQRVTARADLLMGNNPVAATQHYVGVFPTDGANDAINNTPLTWLVSQQNPTTDIDTLALNQDKIRMQRLADGIDDSDDIFADAIQVVSSYGTIGHMAYVIDDEGLKAKVNIQAETPNANDLEERLGQSIVPIPNTLSQLAEDSSLGKETAQKLNSLTDLKSFTPGSDVNELLRHYTLSSDGLLTDVRDGGLKRDLTIAFEESAVFDNVFSGADNLLLTEDRRDQLSFPNGYANWSILRDYYNSFNLIGNDGVMNERTRTDGTELVKINFTHLHDFGPHDLPHPYHNISPAQPIMSRLQYTYWVEYVESPTNPEDYFPRLHIRPVVAYYNPYNVPLVLSRPQWILRNIPSTSLEVGGQGRNEKNLSTNSSMGYVLNDAVRSPILDPGEIMFMSFSGSVPLGSENASGNIANLTSDLAGILNASRYIDWTDVDDVKISVPKDSNGIPLSQVIQDVDIGHAYRLLRWDTNNGIIPNATGGYFGVRQMLFQYINYDNISLNGGKMGKQIPDSTFTFDSSNPNNISQEKTIGVWLRTTREEFNQIRPLVDGNIRFIFGDGRWDQISGIEAMAPFSGSEQGLGSTDSRGEMFTSIPQQSLSGKGLGGGSIDDLLTGSDSVVIFDIPRAPLVSLGQLQHANLARFNYEPTFVIGNSYANIRFPMGDIEGTLSDSLSKADSIAGPFTLYDISYLTNEALWDGYFFSTIPQGMSDEDFEDLMSEEAPLANARLKLIDPEALISDKDDLRDTTAGAGSFETNAALLTVDGMFNVNSTSVPAWKALLTSLAGQEVPRFDLQTGQLESWANENEIRFSKFSAPLGEGFNTGDPDSYDNFWNGYRTLTETQVDELANAIVDQVKQRGPFNSMAEFVNRVLVDDDLGRSGALQAALDDPSVSINSDIPASYQFPASLDGSIGDRISGNQSSGFAGSLSQGDILQALAPVLSVRSDTFRIRAYGDSYDPITQETTGRAWCEAIVQRNVTPVGVNPVNSMTDLVNGDPTFGRQFEIVSFRWLGEHEL
ncbi:hypothetical protein [Rubellicoccus peritrichatus]|uniref:Uncharacterized protein n=1 Tax=Rubellicoccus peritrichatus TaxID=3080537 RepID=A0AAQ3QUE5_9BACT|nr:hypothetical protein [Puniceicoccus sp. CR14]WOO39617.1 hypothetical protein RZN69_13415 [Puniceicoccus sp. CR14]